MMLLEPLSLREVVINVLIFHIPILDDSHGHGKKWSEIEHILLSPRVVDIKQHQYANNHEHPRPLIISS